ncbi:MAG: pre-peptidase C-terminal domain-containing protein [Candidatus Wallbacteria bacterium]|nr:pre-peptidase C-terminal domain-containing protein [Candidatus Wallbacteria bacterium]
MLRRPRDLLPDSPTLFNGTFHSHRIGVPGFGLVEESEDEDAFILFGRQDQTFTVEVYGFADSESQPSPDPQLLVLNPSGGIETLENDGQNSLGVGPPGFRDDIRTPFEVTRGPVNRNARWTFRATANADYYVITKSFFAEPGAYRIRARRDEHPERPQETMTYFDRLPTEQLVPIPPSSPTTVVTTNAFIDFNGDLDAYEMRVTTGTVFRIETNLGGQGLRDSILTLYGRDGRVSETGAQSGVLIIGDDRSLSDRSSLITTVTQSDDIVKVVVGGRNAPTDPFPLSYRLEVRSEKQPVVDDVTPTIADNRGGNNTGAFQVSGSFLETTTSAFLRDTVDTTRIQELALLGTPTATTVSFTIPARTAPNLFNPRVWNLQMRGRLGTSDIKSTASIKFFDDYLDSFLEASEQRLTRPQDQLSSDSSVETSGAIGYPGDRDFFWFTAERNTTYEARTTLCGDLTLPQSVVTVLSTTGSALASGLNSVTFTALATEVRFLLVEGGSLTQTGDYKVRLLIRRTPVVTALSASPATGSNAGGQLISFTGTNFNNTQSITMLDSQGRDVIDLTNIVVASDQSMTARLPSRVTGSKYLPGTYGFRIVNSTETGSTPPGLTITLVDDHIGLPFFSSATLLQTPLLNTPTTTSADLGFPGDSDLFRFRASGEAVYILAVSLLGLGNSQLALLDSNGVPIDSNDDFGGTSASQLEYVVPQARANADHVLSVTGTGPTSVGTYTLTLTLDDHPANVQSTIGRAADALTLGVAAQASLQTTGDVDSFRFIETEDTPYLIETVLDGNPGSLAETRLELVGSNGAVLAASVSPAPGQPSRITTVGDRQTIGTNFVRVQGAGASVAGAYGVRVSVATIPIVTDVCVLPGSCPVAGDPVASNAGGFSVTIVGIALDNPVSVRLAEAAGTEFTITSVAPGRITATLPARAIGQRLVPGAYHVQVTNALNNTSPSTTKSVINLVDDHPETSAALTVADQLAVEGPLLPADIGFAGDVDVFRFNGVANTVYVVEAQRGSAGNVGQISLQVFRGSTQLTAPNSFGGSSTFVNVLATQSGELFLVVRAETATRTGSYGIRVFQARRPVVTAVSPSRGLRDTGTAISVTGSGFLGASQVRLSDPANTILSAPDVSTDSSMRTTVPAGVVPGLYDVLVTNALGVSASGTGKFQVDDHPNVFATLGPDAIRSPRDDLQVNQPAITGTLETPIDRDLYAFQVTLGHTYTVQTNLLTLSDTALTILGSDGATIVGQNEDIDAGRGLFNSQVVFQAGETATFYARVETSNTGSGTYGLAVSDPLAPDDHSNSAAQLNPATDNLAERLAMAGAINYSGDVDFFAFTALRGSVYDVETALGTLSDTVLTLFDRDGVTRLAENDDNPDNVTSRASKLIGFQPAVAGTYFLKVRHLASDPESTGSYTLTFTRRDGSLAVTAVRASQASVSRGQVATLLIDLENTGLHRLTALSGGFDIRAGASSRIADYTLTPDSANVTEFFPGQTATLGFTARVAAGAALGPVRIDARASGLDSGTTISDAASFTTTTWTVQSPAAISIASFVAPVQVSRGQSVTVTMNLDNSGQAEATIDSLSLKLSGTGGVSRDLEYVVTAAPGNPTRVAGIPAGSTARSVRTPVRFLVTVRADATLEAITIDGTFRGRDANSLAALSDDTAATKAQWAVQTAASLFIRSVVGPSAVSQGQTTQVVMNLENPGQSSVTLQSAALRFIDGLGNDLTASDYVVSPLPGNPTTLAARGKAALRFSVFVASGAARTRVVVDGSAFGRDDRTSNPITLIRAEIPAEWIVQRAAALSILALGVSPAVVSRGGTIAITMSVSNPGEADALLSAAGLRFFAASGGAERTAEYRVTASAGNASVVRGEATTTLAFSVTALASASIGINRVEGSVSGFDRNTASSVSAVSNANVSPFFRLSNVFVTIARPQSSDLLFFDEPIAFEGNAVDDLGAPFPGANLAWRSDVSGGFGSGTAFTASLPAATHRVTVTATAGSGITSSVETTLVVRPAPAPIGLLSVSGTLSREATGSPLGRGFEVRLENRARSTIATYVTTDSTGRYTALLLSATGAAAGAGDLVTATIREPGGLQRPTSPASFALRSRDIALGSRLQNLSAADLLETLLTLRRGLNLVGLPLRPATTSGPDFTAADLATFTGSSFVSRVSGEPAAGRGRFEAFVPGQGGAFAIQGNEGYLLHSPLDQTLSLRGSPWAPALLFRQLSKGLNLVALPLGVPPGFDSAQLLGRAPGASFLAELNPQDSGVSRFDVFVPGLSLPVPILDGKGYVLSVPAGGDLLLPAAP